MSLIFKNTIASEEKTRYNNYIMETSRRKGDVSMLSGKLLSILGDSISTYEGVSNDATANPTISQNPYFYREPFPVDKTYWRLVLDALGLTLCVNNSWSGGNLSGRDDPSSGLNRAANLSGKAGAPDIIIVFMGINDLGRTMMINAEDFAADYRETLAKIRKSYPSAKVCCVNLPDRDIYLKERASVFNKAILDAVDEAGCDFFVADLYGSRLRDDFYYMNTLDGLHPDEDGMRIIAEIITESIRNNIYNI